MSRNRHDNASGHSPSPRPVHCIGGLLRANLKAYQDGETSALRGWLVRWHLARCPDCREELRWLQRLGEDMKDIESARPRPELRARILANLPSTPPAPGLRVVHARPEIARSPRRLPRLALASGLVMLLAVSGVFALTHYSHAKPNSDSANVVVKTPSSLRPPTQDTPDTTASAVAAVPYVPEEDPNNARADRMFRQSMAEMEQEKRTQGQDDWHRLLTQARAVARKSDRTPHPEMAVALTVSDVAATRAHLPGWAKRAGATFVTNTRPVAEDSGNTSSPQPRPNETQGNVIAFSLPADRAPAFLTALKQLGQLSVCPTATAALLATSLKPEAYHLYTAVDALGHAVPVSPTAETSAKPDANTIGTTKHAAAVRTLLLAIVLQPSTH